MTAPTAPGTNATFSPADLAMRTVQRRAVEAAVRGIPIVNYDLMFQAGARVGATMNQIVYWSKLLDWKNQTLTPNPNSIYLMPFFDTAAAGPNGATRYVDAYPKVWKTLSTYNVSFLRLLAETIEVEPPQAKDAAMLAMAASIGIKKGTPFHPDAKRAQLLTAAVREGEATMNGYFMNRAFDPFWPNRHWVVTKPGSTFAFSYYGDGTLDYDRRAGSFAYFATWMLKKLGDPAKLPATYYFNSFRDSTGTLFRGDSLYHLHMPADTPAHDFWSIIAYEVGTNAFIHDPQNRVGVSSYDKGRMAVNQDGLVDVYIGPAAPDGQTSNSIPTGGKNFWLIARFYGPNKCCSTRRG